MKMSKMRQKGKKEVDGIVTEQEDGIEMEIETGKL